MPSWRSLTANGQNSPKNTFIALLLWKHNKSLVAGGDSFLAANLEVTPGGLCLVRGGVVRLERCRWQSPRVMKAGHWTPRVAVGLLAEKGEMWDMYVH